MKYLFVIGIQLIYSWGSAQELQATFIDSLNTKYDTIVQKIFLKDSSDFKNVIISNQHIEISVNEDDDVLLNKFISSLPKNSVKTIVTKNGTLNLSSLEQQSSSLECLITLFLDVDTILRLKNLKNFLSFTEFDRNIFKVLNGSKQLEYVYMFTTEQNSDYLSWLPNEIKGLSINIDTIKHIRLKKLNELHIFPTDPKVGITFTKHSKLIMPNLKLMTLSYTLNSSDIEVIKKLKNIEYLGAISVSSMAIDNLYLLTHINFISINNVDFQYRNKIEAYKNVYFNTHNQGIK